MRGNTSSRDTAPFSVSFQSNLTPDRQRTIFEMRRQQRPRGHRGPEPKSGSLRSPRVSGGRLKGEA